MKAFLEYVREIEALGREVNPRTLAASRSLAAPRLQCAPFEDVEIARDLRYGGHERQRLDLFTPRRGEEDGRPLLVFVHGGGFVAGDKYTPGTPFYDNIGAWAVRQGCSAANMTYRLAPEHRWPAGIEDIRLALQWLRGNAAEHGISAERIFLMGQSTGAAHAAAYVAHPHIYAPGVHGLAGLVLLSGLYDFTTLRIGDFERAYLGSDESRYAARSSLSGLVDSGIPLMVTLAEFDPPFFEAQTLQLLRAWQERHGRLPRFVQLTGQNHFSTVLYLGLEGDLLGPQLHYFIQRHL